MSVIVVDYFVLLRFQYTRAGGPLVCIRLDRLCWRIVLCRKVEVSAR